MRLLTTLAALALGPGCSGSDSEPGSAASARPTPSGSPSGTPSASDFYGTPTCGEVRAGIAAFNQGDFDGTVRHFEKAVPLAKKAADGSQESALLLRAVRYYAALAPADYPQASATSTEFARWKIVTLGLCEAPGQEPAQPSPSASDPGTLT